MWRFLIPLILATTTSGSLDPFYRKSYSAATPAQIRFAKENKYDSTGPGAKGTEYAYNTFKTLDDALIGYLDDPDTKLPDYERAKAIHLLYNSKSSKYFDFRPMQSSTNDVQESRPSFSFYDSRFQAQKSLYPFRWQKVQSVKGSPVNLAHYMKEPIAEEVNQSPQFSFFHGNHNKKPSESRSSQESHQDGIVHGYYTFVDHEGKQRTVQYMVDDQRGFQPTVHRTFATH